MNDGRLLVLHVLFRLDTGGLEQVFLETVRGLSDRYRHVVISLTTASSALKSQLPEGCEVYELHKREGQDPGVWWRAFRLIRLLSPDIMHTYNLACLEFQVLAFLNRVPLRLHAEHGRSAADPNGTNRKHRFLRRTMRLVVHRWITVSKDLQNWLCNDIGIQSTNVVLIYNGVDTARFQPSKLEALPPDVQHLYGNCDANTFVVGTVGRLDPVKNHERLINAWALMVRSHPRDTQNMMLAIIGGGGNENRLQELVADENLCGCIWIAGEQSNIACLIQRFNLFVLPSIAEGLPMTLLESMASGLPVLASRVGGIPEVVTPATGSLIDPFDEQALGNEILSWRVDRKRRDRAATKARTRVVEEFGLQRMIDSYADLYVKGTNVAPPSRSHLEV